MHIARVALRVSDLDRSIDWYGRVVGLALREREDGTAALGAPDGGPVLLELRRAERAGVAPRNAAGLFHTAFRYPTRAALGSALRRIVTGRESFTGASDHAVSEALYLDDPDAIGVELYRDRPRDEWPPPREGAKVFMVSEPLDADGVLDSAESDLPEAAHGVDIGHVHLKVADVEQAVAFWTGDVEMELMARYGTDAAFIADEGYHHHVGANRWYSRDADLEPQDGPGIDHIVIAGAPEREVKTPDGVRVVFEP
ncbi:MAG TPA: VOC family protein [Thermoleophilaceae bacterium]|nr:VOC family protein [Thermoleophilaceae bacterium]